MLTAQVVVGFLAVGAAKIQGIPLDPVTHAQRDVPQLVGFRERPGVAEMAGRGFARFDCYRPVLVDLLAAPLALRRRWKRLRALSGKRSAASGIAALGPDPHHAALAAA